MSKLVLQLIAERGSCFAVPASPGSWSFQDRIPKLELGNERKMAAVVAGFLAMRR